MDSNFDNFFKEKFDQNEFTYQPEHWNRLERALPGQRRILPFLLPGKKLAAGIAAGIALAAGFFFCYHNTPNITSPDIAGTHTAQVPGPIPPTTTPEPATILSEAAVPAKPSVTITPGTSATHLTSSTKPKSGYTANISPVQNITTPLKEAENSDVKNIVIAAPASEKQEPAIPVEQKQPPVAQPATEQSFARVPVPARKEEKLTLASYDFTEEPKHRQAASMGVIGGLNYGTQNTGFSLGVNARYRFNDRLFVEGAVTYNNNQAQNTESMTSGRFQARTTATWNGQIQSEPLPVELRTLSYLQVMPSVGYHLSEKLSMGLGADVQRLLYNTEYKTVTYTNNDTKLVPATDFGLAAKAEYGISSRIKAGVLYREGLNTLFAYGYINRRYVQMQLSWSLFGGK